MPDEPSSYGPLTALSVEALGNPGERTFCIRAQNEQVGAVLWLEKEQLQALALAIEQLLAQVPREAGRQPTQAPSGLHEPPSMEFKVGRLALGYVEQSNLFALLVHSLDADPEGPATLVCLASRPQLRALSRQIVKVSAAGRPRCPLCGEPINPEGHHCVRLN